MQFLKKLFKRPDVVKLEVKRASLSILRHALEGVIFEQEERLDVEFKTNHPLGYASNEKHIEDLREIISTINFNL
jgi:hypothetical protein